MPDTDKMQLTTDDSDTLITVITALKEYDRDTKIRVIKSLVAFFGIEGEFE